KATKSKAACGFLAAFETAAIIFDVPNMRPDFSPGAMGGNGTRLRVFPTLAVANPRRSQLPVLYMAALPLWKRVMASGYAVVPQAPVEKIRSFCNLTSIASAWTSPGLVNLALPANAASQTPGAVCST